MESIKKILDALREDDLDEVKRLTKIWQHHNEIRHNFQNLFIDKSKNQIRCYMKVYCLEENKWSFHGYGNLSNDRFIMDKSLLYLFHLENLSQKIRRHPTSPNHLLIMDNNNNKYLLYNPYPAIILSLYNFFNKY